MRSDAHPNLKALRRLAGRQRRLITADTQSHQARARKHRRRLFGGSIVMASNNSTIETRRH